MSTKNNFTQKLPDARFEYTIRLYSRKNGVDVGSYFVTYRIVGLSDKGRLVIREPYKGYTTEYSVGYFKKLIKQADTKKTLIPPDKKVKYINGIKTFVEVPHVVSPPLEELKKEDENSLESRIIRELRNLSAQQEASVIQAIGREPWLLADDLERIQKGTKAYSPVEESKILQQMIIARTCYLKVAK